MTYKWPSWLRKQTEKQRQIWAYKILFLDVLFPNAVEKVIYIDADQVAIPVTLDPLWFIVLVLLAVRATFWFYRLCAVISTISGR